MDYLSFLVLREKPFFCLPGSGQADCIVLNSVSNLAKALTLLDGYGHIYCFWTMTRRESGRWKSLAGSSDPVCMTWHRSMRGTRT